MARKGQSGFISVALGFALLAVFGSISVGIEAAHRKGEQQQVHQPAGETHSVAKHVAE